MQVEICKTVEIVTMAHVTIEDITAALGEYQQRAADSMDDGAAGARAAEYVHKGMLGAAYQCLAAVPDELIAAMPAEHRRIIAQRLIEQTDRYRTH